MTESTRPDLLQAEYGAACERIGDLCAEVEKAEAQIAKLAARVGEQHTALKWAEAVMSIVEPRSDKAEYLECLTAVRQALASDGSAVADVITKLRIAREAPDYGREYAWDELWKAFDRLDNGDK